MPNWLLRCLAKEWAGTALAVGLGLIGGLAWSRPQPTWHWLGVGLLVAAALIGTGNLVHLLRLARIRAHYPPTGRLIDLGGYRVHLVAEGNAGDNLPIVTFGGSHSAGLSMAHIHAALKGLTRSILIDRPGTGWSDTGPLPRTTAREAEEMVAALERAGEKGPFVFVGYSFGGLLAANIARRRPDLVARLILFDATPLETIVFGPRLGAIRDMLRDSLTTGILRQIGLAPLLARRAAARSAAHGEANRAFRETLGPAHDELLAIEASAGSQIANYSIYHELLGTHVGSCGWETVVYDGDLGTLPTWLVAPGEASEVTANQEVAAAGGTEAARMLRFFAMSRERYMAISSNSRRVIAPPGSTHQFVYTHPQFAIDTLVAAIRPGAA